ncbi:CRISPR-associated protein Cas4 [Haloferax marisrubri]|uniref:CRISPR-associated protein Cas4 n=1 Tax=Haloferax marisrubri TaxID=1544719 RepID=UPI000AAA0A68|nr:PD-(D/E)XK nuclease family protein [Haloferax marisrubri]
MNSNFSPEGNSVVEFVVDTVGTGHFDDWQNEREFRENIRTGKPYFNTPPPVKPAKQHNPSQLNQCHRKIYYRQLNAPDERESPDGIFWTGTKFEEEVAMPYLEAVVRGQGYVRNSMWVDYTLDTEHGDIRIRGETDPVIVDSESRPLLLTEIKTKRSVDHLTAPNEHHVAQLFAYMEGLSREWETEVREGLVIYGDRTNLSIKPFFIRFDSKRWDELVIRWAESHTEYRLNEELPPAAPEFPWECEFCSYRHRCGQSDETHHKDLGPDGILPGIDYPEERIVEYLRANPNYKLLPSLATVFPDLTDEFQVHDWVCEACPSTTPYDSHPTGQTMQQCPHCRERGVCASLQDPEPEVQKSLAAERSHD